MESLKELMIEFDIESSDDFVYFEQFSAMMESDSDISQDTFAELLSLPDSENLHAMTVSFFEDVIRGVPDDNIELYASIQAIKDVLTALTEYPHSRSFAFFVEELYRFREWYNAPETVTCQPLTDSGSTLSVSACSALMLYREEKLSNERYEYDFSDHMPEEPDEYTLEVLDEIKEEYALSSDAYNDDYDEDNAESLDDILRQLPDEYDPDTYDIEDYLSSPIDPYKDGFVDRFNPVIDGEFSDDGDEKF